MAEEIIGSHEKARNAYGQNGYQGASSLTPGQTKAPTADVSPPQIAAPGLRHEDSLAARTAMDGDKAAAYPHSPSLPPRSVSSGSPGGEVPASNLRRDSGKSLLR
jgi:hypothetical protein